MIDGPEEREIKNRKLDEYKNVKLRTEKPIHGALFGLLLEF